MTNADVFTLFATGQFKDGRGTTNIKINKWNLGWVLTNYGTPISYVYNSLPNIYFFNHKKYSITTLKVQNQLYGRIAQENKIIISCSNLSDLEYDITLAIKTIFEQI